MSPEPRSFAPPSPRDDRADLLRCWERAARILLDVKTEREAAYARLVIEGLISTTQQMLGRRKDEAERACGREQHDREVRP